MPNSTAAIAVSVVGIAAPMPGYSATFFPGEPYLSVGVLQTNGSGVTSEFLETPSIAPSFCGFEFFAQGIVVDPSGPGGLAVTSALRIVVGLEKSGIDKLFEPEIGLSGPVDVATADFNGDGYADVAIACDAGDDVAVLLGRGDGTFDERVSFPVGDRPFTVAAADFDLDGIQDLAVGCYNSEDVVVLYGVGDGTFMSGTNLAINGPCSDLAVGDFDSDGLLDIVTVSPSTGIGPGVGVSLLLQDGNGGFEPAIALGLGDHLRSITAGDINGDGNVDIAATQTNVVDRVHVRFGAGDGSFPNGSLYAVGLTPTDVAIADLNGDGLAEVISTDAGANALSVLHPIPGGQFVVQQGAAFIGGGPRALQVADVTGDKVLDIVTANGAGGTFAVAVGDGLGGFTQVVEFEAGSTPESWRSQISTETECRTSSWSIRRPTTSPRF
ncbi:MAG: VCBS repeat-containing protein [Planctomycetota bacterium]